MKTARMRNRVGVGVLLSAVATLVLMVTHATPTLSQEASILRVSNLAQPFIGSHWGVGRGQLFAQSFCSGGAAVTLDKVRLLLMSQEADRTTMFYERDPAPLVTIRADRSGRPGTVLETLTSPVIDNVTVAAKDFTGSGYELAADTIYWVVLGRPSGTGHIAFDATESKREDSETVAGWSIGDTLLWHGGRWAEQPQYAMKMAVYANSVPASLSTPAFPDSNCDGSAESIELSVDENAAAGTVVGKAAARDLDDDALTHSVSGTDAAKFNRVFNLDASTGEITVKPGASIDYEDSDKSYAITVSVTDGEDATGATEDVATTDATVAVSIRVNDIDEPGIITLLPSATPRVNSEMTVSLDDDDDDVRIYTIQWSWADTPTGEFTNIPINPKNMSDPSFTPTNALQGKFLKVNVLYVEHACRRVSSGHNWCRKHESRTLDQAVAAAEAEIASLTVNSPATGSVSITGTPVVGQTLTADTTGISDSDGMTSATFTYQWLADDTEISGATDSSYTLVAGDQGKPFQVRVTFTDDAGNEESLSSNRVAAQPVVARDPLTASTHDVPDSHDGATAFTFELRFSEEPKSEFSYLALQLHALSVTGGTVDKARRLAAPSNIRWEITVTPDSSSDVTIALPVTTDCAGQGAVCTGDGRMLSERVELTISAPPVTASIHSAPESHDGSTDFTFELRFSEAPTSGFSYTTVQNHALTVTGGTLPKVRRLVGGQNLRWEVTVKPSSTSDVTIVLPITSDCTAQGAICTDDGRKLSTRMELTVSGPGR